MTVAKGKELHPAETEHTLCVFTVIMRINTNQIHMCIGCKENMSKQCLMRFYQSP